MMCKRILVTGGTGFLGSSLLDWLKSVQEPNYHFTLLSRNAEKFADIHPEYSILRNVDFISADVRDLSQLKGKFPFIIHGATPLIHQPSDEELRKIIISGTTEILQLAQRAETEKLLYISSGGVYGNGTEAFSEDSVCNPVSVYGKAKLEAEKLLLDSEIPCSIMRGFAFAGKHLPRNAHFAFGNFLDDALHNRDIIIKGDGTPVRSYMHSDDLAEWMMVMLLKGENKRIYNCGSDMGISIRSLAELIRNTVGSSSEIKVLSSPDPLIPVNTYVPDISRAKNELGLQLKVDLKKAIELSMAK